MYPGLAVVQALRGAENVEVTYVGGRGGIEQKLAARAEIPFAGIPAGGLHGVGLREAATNVGKLARGLWAAYTLGRRERPSVLFATGGYASVPVAVAAWLLRVPILVYLPDVEPGLAVRFIARLASKVAVTVEASRGFFADRKVVVTGYPVRRSFADVEQEEAREALGLASGDPVLVVMGGSRGARSINQAVASVLDGLLEVTQVIHLSGELDWPWVADRRQALPGGLRKRYVAMPYLHDMAVALAAADLALCRAGASTLGELPFFGLPGVLVPYPHAWRYQRVNAAWLTDRGAAVTLRDEKLDGALLPTVRQLIMDEERLQKMAHKARALSRPRAAGRLAETLLQLA